MHVLFEGKDYRGPIKLGDGLIATQDADGLTILSSTGEGGGGSVNGVIVFNLLDKADSLGTGKVAHFPLPDAFTITEAWILASRTGSATIDFWVTDWAGFASVSVADSICGGNPLMMPNTGVKQAYDDVLTGWTTALSSRDIITVNISAIANGLGNAGGVITIALFGMYGA